jgi:hypothetical protein
MRTRSSKRYINLTNQIADAGSKLADARRRGDDPKHQLPGVFPGYSFTY